MFNPRIFLFFVLCLVGFSALATDAPPECFTFYAAPEEVPAATLEQAAATCPINALAELYQNRARHVALVQRYGQNPAVARLPRDDYERHLESHRIYIALLELFAMHYDGDVSQLIEAMNSGYRTALGLAKLRLEGYEQRAQWLEWIKTLPQNGVRN